MSGHRSCNFWCLQRKYILQFIKIEDCENHNNVATFHAKYEYQYDITYQNTLNPKYKQNLYIISSKDLSGMICWDKVQNKKEHDELKHIL